MFFLDNLTARHRNYNEHIIYQEQALEYIQLVNCIALLDDCFTAKNLNWD